MSESEKIFIMKMLKWVAGIVGSLVVLFIGGAIVTYQTVGILGNKVDNNTIQNQEIRETHRQDINNVYNYVRDIRADQKELLKTQKEILKELK